MSPKALYIKPLIYGLLADIGGTAIFFSITAGILFLNGDSDFSYDLSLNPLTEAPMIFIGFLFSIFGGYIAGRTAKNNKILHGTLVGVILGVIGFIAGVLAPLTSDEVLVKNILIDSVSALLTILAAYAGGVWASSLETPEETTRLMGLLNKVHLSGGVSMVLLLVLIAGFSGSYAYVYERIPDCTVEMLYIQGGLYTTSSYTSETVSSEVSETYSAWFPRTVEEIEKNDDIKAVLIDIDSPGGDPVAGEEIANALKNSSKEVIVLIRSIGASAAYWAASGGDVIFASNNSNVGGIGVQVNYLDNYEKNKKEGLNPNIVTSAKYKTLGDPNVPLTPEEREILQNDVDEIHKNFVQAISENRGMSVEAVEALADGSTMLGSKALSLGLIDKIGDMSEIKKYLKDKYGTEPKICESSYEES